MEEWRFELSFKALCIGDVFETVATDLDGDATHTYVSGAFEALGLLRSEPFDAIVARLPIPGCTTPATLLEEVHRISQQVRVIFCDPNIDVERAINLVKAGAFDVVSEERLSYALRRCIATARSTPPHACPPSEPWRQLLIGGSPGMLGILDIIRLIADRRCTVLITGETGTGKEMIARAIHQAGNRAPHALVSINCSALPEELLEAELFGHVRGAFTGAIAHRTGRFEQAHRGTLFLDEIGDMPPSLQAKLLRVLQEREFQRLGSSDNVRVDVRVIAATNVDLAERLRQGKFREDLYYRLNVVPIHLPPLRDRPADVPPLALHFADRICREEGIAVKDVSPDLLLRLSRHDWPGNVRQLENAMEMAIALSGNRAALHPADFPFPSRLAARPLRPGLQPFVAVPDQGLDFEQTVGSIERHILEQALTKTNGNKKAAAQMLNLKRTTLSAKLKTLAATAAVAG
jgi:DNA-binding NtrC family response regulator